MRTLRIVPIFLFVLLLGGCGGDDESGGGGGGGGRGSPVSITTSSLAAGDVGVAYNATISTSGGSGSGYTWSVSSGALPAGLSLVQGSPDATISGTPAADGTFNFVLQVDDPAGGSDSQALSIVINAAAPPPLAITTTSLPNGIDGTAYSQPVTAAGGTQSGYNWSVISGVLPGGLTLVSGTPSATLQGTPNSVGTFNFTLQVQDSAGATATMAYTVDIDPAALTITTTTLPDGSVGFFYQQAISATGGSGAYSWSIITGSPPPGLGIVSGTPAASLEGTPTTHGSYSFIMEVMDSLSNVDAQSFTININPTALVITTTSLPNGSVSAAYSQDVSAIGGTQPYSWDLSSGQLSYGLALNSGTPNATISGTPHFATTLNFTVRVRDSVGASGLANLSIVIQPSALSVPAANLDYAVEGFWYDFRVACQGGTGGGAWSVVSGSLPVGVSLLSAINKCVISGVPTVSGTFVFMLQIVDGQSNTATQQFTLDVNAASGALVIANQRFGPYAVGATPYFPGATLNAAGGSGGGYNWAFATGSQVPPGMGISAGSLGGTFTQAGAYPVTLEVTDSAFNVATRSYTIVVEDGGFCFGVPVRQQVVFVIDASGSMSGSGVATVRAEVTQALNSLPAMTEFDCASFGDQFGIANSYTNFLWQGLFLATAGNVSAAITWVNGPALNPGGGTPTYPCVQKVCQTYPSTLGSIFLISDGNPNTGGSASQILADFPAWSYHFNDCRLNTVSIYGGGSTFMQSLAALGGGAYVAP